MRQGRGLVERAQRSLATVGQGENLCHLPHNIKECVSNVHELVVEPVQCYNEFKGQLKLLHCYSPIRNAEMILQIRGGKTGKTGLYPQAHKQVHSLRDNLHCNRQNYLHYYQFPISQPLSLQPCNIAQ